MAKARVQQIEKQEQERLKAEQERFAEEQRRKQERQEMVQKLVDENLADSDVRKHYLNINTHVKMLLKYSIIHFFVNQSSKLNRHCTHYVLVV